MQQQLWWHHQRFTLKSHLESFAQYNFLLFFPSPCFCFIFFSKTSFSCHTLNSLKRLQLKQLLVSPLITHILSSFTFFSSSLFFCPHSILFSTPLPFASPSAPPLSLLSPCSISIFSSYAPLPSHHLCFSHLLLPSPLWAPPLPRVLPLLSKSLISVSVSFPSCPILWGHAVSDRSGSLIFQYPGRRASRFKTDH